MKTKKIFFIFIVAISCSSVFLISCKEDIIGQYPVDKIPPGSIENPSVENFPGRSKITYKLPPDDDLLYVKAQYVRPNGKQVEERVSYLNNTIEVKGFGKSKKTTVKLIAVDRSRNESRPVSLEIEPEDSPIYDILKTLKVITSWGG